MSEPKPESLTLKNESKSKSEKEFLASYNIHDFDVPLTSVDMVIFTIKDAQLKMLLIKRAQYPAKGKWALPGGFIDVKHDKTLDDTATRKLFEKTGVKTPYLEQVSTFGNSKRDPRGWALTVAYFALISSEDIELKNHESTEEVRWVPVDDVSREYKLAFDHQSILDACKERLRNKVEYTSLPVNLLPEAFTLTELQQTFEIVLQQPVAKKSFRKRMLDANIFEETGELKTGSNRPAKLYRVLPNGDNHFFTRSLEGPR